MRSIIFCLFLIGNLLIACESFASCDLPEDELIMPELAEFQCPLPAVSEVPIKRVTEVVIGPMSKLNRILDETVKLRDNVISDLDRKVMRLVKDAGNL